MEEEKTIDEILKTEYDVSEKWFDVFREEFINWIHHYGVKGWEFHYIHGDVEDARASVSTDKEARLALVTLSKTWSGIPPNDFEIRKVAFHEATELFLSRINSLARQRYINENEIEEEIHNIIRILENIWWVADYEERNNNEAERVLTKRGKANKPRKKSTSKSRSKSV